MPNAVIRSMLKFSIAIFILMLTLNSCLFPDGLGGGGSDTLLKQSSNKQKNKKVVLFLRQSGATVGDSYQVSIMDYNENFDTSEVGNTFTVDDNHGKTGLDSTSVNFNWLSNDTLQIDYDKNLRTFSQETYLQKIVIVYKPR